MRLREFLAAPSGRIYTGTTAFAALAAGFIGLAGPLAPPAAIPLVALACILAGLATIVLAIDRFPGGALWLTLIMPLEGALYFAGLHVVGSAGPFVLSLLFAIGVASLVTAASGGRLPRFAAPAPPDRHHGTPLGSAQ